MSAKHTPGPWNVRDDGMSYVCPIIDAPSVGKGYYASIATVTQRDPHPQHGGGISMATAEANARLIAAAPDLLEALETLVSMVHMSPDLWQRARVAIARAKGSA